MTVVWTEFGVASDHEWLDDFLVFPSHNTIEQVLYHSRIFVLSTTVIGMKTHLSGQTSALGTGSCLDLHSVSYKIGRGLLFHS